MLFVEIDRIQTRRGVVAICQTDSQPWSAPPYSVTYVAVVVEPHDYDGPPVAMFSTVKDPRHETFQPVEGTKSNWDGSTPQLDNVYRCDEFTGDATDPSPALAVGRAMHELGLFQSVDGARSDPGQRWAEQVCLDPGERTSIIDAEEFGGRARPALRVLNDALAEVDIDDGSPSSAFGDLQQGELTCAHEVSHAVVAWTLGYDVVEFCIRQGRGINVAPVPQRPTHGFAIATAGRYFERRWLGIPDPSGCGADNEHKRATAHAAIPGHSLARDALDPQAPAVVAVARELKRRAWSAQGTEDHLDGCPDPAVVAEIVARHWDTEASALPPALQAHVSRED